MKNKIFIFYFFVLLINALPTHAQIITTIVGDSTSGYCCDDSLAVEAELNKPPDVAVDVEGNVYITDGENNRIRKINTAGIISTIAGTGAAGYNGDGIAATIAEINYPSALILDNSGNIYFCDDHNYRVRKINTSGIISTIAGTGLSGYSGDNGPATLAQITSSLGIAIDGTGQIYFGDILNNRIRKISPASGGIISTIAGTGIQGYLGDGGPSTLAELYYPTGVTVDGLGNVYFAEHGNNCIRKINNSGVINTIAGNGSSGFSGDNGPATLAQLSWPNGLKVDRSGNIYFADVYNNRVRKIDNSGIITTIAGTGTGSFSGDGGPAIDADLNTPEGVAINSSVDIFIADAANNRIRFIRNTVFTPSINNSFQKLEVYPNPNKGEFTVNIISDVDEKVTILINNIIGNVIKEIIANTNAPIDISLKIPCGIYILTEITTHGWRSEKIVIMDEVP